VAEPQLSVDIRPTRIVLKQSFERQYLVEPGQRQFRSCCIVKQSIVHVALVVRDYDEAIDFYTKTLNFTLVEDTYQPEQNKRWEVVAPPGPHGATLLLARASNPKQETFVGNQTGGRVFLFLNTDDFWRDYNEMIEKGVNFVREPKTESYGIVAVFEDLYGNLWDLLQLNSG
jgi:catechol 2,3-dioxygenase-like lactoylglutathione lyase family enzyme